MTYHRAYYSIIQYCPDSGRAEAANLGVLVLCPELEFVAVKTASGNERVRRFFGSEAFDAARLQLMKRAIETRVREKFDWSEGLADLERFIATRANDLQLTAPRSLKTADPEADLEGLFDELVGGRARSRREKPEAFVQLRSALRAPGIRERIRLDERVVVPVLAKDLTIPYAYQNGNLNLVKPHVFRGTDDSATRHAAELALEGDLIQRYAEKKQRLIVIPAFSNEALPMSERIIAMFGEYDIRVVSENAIEEFVSEIDATAHLG